MKSDTLHTQKVRQVTIVGRKNGHNENIISVVCDLYDMSCYVDILRRCVQPDSGFDYIIVEPYKLKDLFDDASF